MQAAHNADQPPRRDTVGLDLECLAKKSMNLSVEVLVLHDEYDKGKPASAREIREIEQKAKFLVTLVGILRLKLEHFPQQNGGGTG